MDKKITFGKFISQKRKEKGFTQKDLASKVKKEDGRPITPQYLNDLEHDRRNPPSEFILKEMARVLGISEELIFFHAGELHPEMKGVKVEPEKFEAAYKAFRRELKK